MPWCLGALLPVLPKLAINEWDVDLIFLIILRQGIHYYVNPQHETLEALEFAARKTFVRPIPQVIALPCPAQVVLTIDQRRRVVDRHAFEREAHQASASDCSYQVVRAEHRMVKGETFESLIGEHALDFLANPSIEWAAAIATGIVDQHETTEPKEAS